MYTVMLLTFYIDRKNFENFLFKIWAFKNGNISTQGKLFQIIDYLIKTDNNKGIS